MYGNVKKYTKKKNTKKYQKRQHSKMTEGSRPSPKSAMKVVMNRVMR